MSSTLKTQAISSTVDDFKRPNIRGGEQSLSAALAGKKGAVVVFWSGICSHCTRYDEYLNKFEARHPELALIGVASGEMEKHRNRSARSAPTTRLTLPDFS